MTIVSKIHNSNIVQTRNNAFTIVELLVCIFIFVLLVAFLFPAIYSVRETARSLECSNHLKQIGLAIAGYNDSNNSLPIGRVQSFDPRYAGPNPPCTSQIVDRSILVRILPYFEQMSLYNMVNNSCSIFALENHTIHTVTISGYACPSDFTSGVLRVLPSKALLKYGYPESNGRQLMAISSYAACEGSLEVAALQLPSNNCIVPMQAIQQNNGTFNDSQNIRMNNITDGLSNTIFFSERTGNYLQNVVYSDVNLFSERGWFISGNWGDTLFSAQFPINAFKKVSRSAGFALSNGASSLHNGGVNVLFGDGSIRFLSEHVQSWEFSVLTGYPRSMTLGRKGFWSNIPTPGIWQALCTRSSGEISRVDEF